MPPWRLYEPSRKSPSNWQCEGSHRTRLRLQICDAISNFSQTFVSCVTLASRASELGRILMLLISRINHYVSCRLGFSEFITLGEACEDFL